MEIREQAFAGLPIDVPVIDAHTHILGYGHNGWYQSFTSTGDVVKIMDHLGIDCIVTAPHSLIIGDMDLTNEESARAAREFPGRVYGYIFVRPQEGVEKVRTIIEKYSKNPAFVGFKFLPGYHGPLAVPEYDYALDFAAEAGCPVLSHLWGTDPTLADVERAVRQRPKLKLMMAHQGGGSQEMTNAYTKLMMDYPNLYMEICGSLYNQYSMEQIVALAGEDRVIFGSDQINLDPRFDFCRVTLSTLPDTVKKKILAENFLRLLEGSTLGKIELKR